MSHSSPPEHASGPTPPREQVRSPEQDQQQLPDPATRCAACNGEIPASAAVHEEGLDYVRHFCSTTCAEQWQEQARTEEGSLAPERARPGSQPEASDSAAPLPAPQKSGR